jgi:hypothetical protein
MDTTLRTIYLRLNKSADTLAKTATQQLVIKILFQLQNRVPYDKLFNEYKNTLKRAHVSKDVFDSILHALIESNDIKYKNKEYYISTSKRVKN